MSTITFDTLKFAERLEKAGLTREQASAIAEAQKDSLAEALDSTLATKADFVRLENRIDGMGKDIQSMELRLIIKLGAFFMVAVGILLAVMRLPH